MLFQVHDQILRKTRKPYLAAIKVPLQAYITGLEQCLKQQPMRRAELHDLEDGEHTEHQSHGLQLSISNSEQLSMSSNCDQLLSTSESLQRFAVTLLHDSVANRDVELHLALLLNMLNSGEKRGVLLRVFEIVSTRYYRAAVNSLLIALILIGVAEDFERQYTGPLLSILLVDMLVQMYLHFLVLKPVQVNDTVLIPWRLFTLNPRLISIIAYPSLLAAVTVILLAGQDVVDSDHANYILPSLFVLRNERMWPSIVIFASSIFAAAPVAYLFLCLLLVITVMATVLLHGKLDTGGFYEDNQVVCSLHTK